MNAVSMGEVTISLNPMHQRALPMSSSLCHPPGEVEPRYFSCNCHEEMFSGVPSELRPLFVVEEIEVLPQHPLLSRRQGRALLAIEDFRPERLRWIGAIDDPQIPAPHPFADDNRQGPKHELARFRTLEITEELKRHRRFRASQ